MSSFLSVSPYPEKAAKDLKTELAKYGVDIDDQEFLTVPFVQFSKYLEETINDIRLGALLSAAGVQMNDILTYLCYGEEGVDYTLVNGKPQMNEGKEELRLKDLLQAKDGIAGLFYDVPLHVLLDIDLNDENKDDPLMVAICFGSDNVHYTNVNVDGRLVPTMKEIIYTATHETVNLGTPEDPDEQTVHTLFDEFGRKIKDATYNEETGVFVILGGEKILYAVNDPTLEANQYRVYDTQEGTPTPLKFKKRTVQDMIGGASDLIMDFQTIFYATIVVAGVVDEYCFNITKENSIMTLGAIAIIFTGFLLIKRVLHSIVNNILFSKSISEEWNSSYFFATKLWGFTLAPAALAILFVPAVPLKYVGYYSILTLALYLYTIISGVYKIIFEKKCIYVDIFLYLCALEFLPMAMVWKTILQLSDFITIKI